jgi:hypothetical protein
MRRLVTVLASLAACAGLVRAEDAPKDPPAMDEPKKPDDEKKPDRDQTRGYIGISWQVAQSLDEEDRQKTGIKLEKGFVITHVTEDGPAEKAGVKVGDVPLSFHGKPFPDGSDLPPNDENAFKKFYEEKLKPHTDTIDPGMSIELTVDRAGTKKTFSIKTIDRAAMDALVQAERMDESWGKVPKPEDRGAPQRAAFDFEKVAEGADKPEGFFQANGYWERQEEEGKPENHVIAQTGEEPQFAVGLVVGDGRVYADSKTTVRFRLVGGEQSVSAGVVVRARNRRYFYVARIDGVAQTLEVLKVEAGAAKSLASTPAKSLKLGTWHSLEVVAKGDRIEASVAGLRVSAQDATYASGWNGVATYLDAKTAFDDLEIVPLGSK